MLQLSNVAYWPLAHSLVETRSNVCFWPLAAAATGDSRGSFRGKADMGPEGAAGPSTPTVGGNTNFGRFAVLAGKWRDRSDADNDPARDVAGLATNNAAL